MSLQCYNKGCGQKYDETGNDGEDCQHHPGSPIFHDATKKWSCCGKWSTDFSEFLSIKGCSKGPHSNVKPEKPEPEEANDTIGDTPVVEKLPKPIPKVPKSRPDSSELKIVLPVTVTSSAKNALEKKMAAMQIQEQNNIENGEESIIRPGAACKHNGCQTTYKPDCDHGRCVYHPGYPVFHEGCKFWSCCNIKKTDFSDFLKQEGCATGEHSWTTREEEKKKRVDCRFDHFQTGNNVTINVYAKATVPDRCSVKVNQVAVDVDVVFEGGECNFTRKFNLAGVIDPSRSSVKLSGTKVEIILRKAGLESWKSLEL